MPFSPTLRLRAGVPGSVRAEVGLLGDRQVVRLDLGPNHRRGALSSEAGETLAHAVQTAIDEQLPLVAIVSSSGADIGEGIASLHGWGVAARAMVRASGMIPLLAIVDGPAVSGPALLLGLADQVVMTRRSYAFVSGPSMVRQFTGVPISIPELGGSQVHERHSGAVALVADDVTHALELMGELLSYLPPNVDEEPPRETCTDPADRPTPEAGDLIPDTPTGSYDVRRVIESLVDHGEHLELRPSWAPNLITTLARVDGRPIGVVANQPQAIAGTLDIPASQKGARFVAFCDAHNVPLVTFVDTPGFYPGKDLEWRGMIRHGAQLAFAYARATVPRISVTLRKSYGGAYIVMDSKRMGCDLTLAWPSAEIAVMGAKGAAEILHRRATPEERAAHEQEYEERLLNPWVAAERGLLDMVIDPADTRRELSAALEILSSAREHLVPRSHDNTPL